MEPVSLLQAVGLAVVTGVGGWVTAYYGAFWKKKGEQAATHDDLENVLKEMRAVTKTTEGIKTEISGGLWDRQKRWEMKREVLFETMRRVAAVYNQLNDLDVFLQTELKHPEQKATLNWQQTKVEKNEKWFRSVSELTESRLFVEISCGRELVDALVKYRNRVSFVAGTINKGNGEIYRQSIQQIITLRDNIRDAVRKELGINELSTPQSAESSAAPTPD